MANIHIFIWIFQLFRNMYLKYSPFPIGQHCYLFHSLLLLLFSRPVMSDSLWPHGLQQARPLCPSPSAKVCPGSCTLHQWCHPAISPSKAVFSFCLQSFPASGTFPMSQLFASDDQNTGVLASTLILPRSIQGRFPLRLTFLISLLSKGLSGIFSSITVQRHQFFGACLLYGPALKQLYMTTEKTIALSIQTFVDRVMSLLFNTV